MAKTKRRKCAREILDSWRWLEKGSGCRQMNVVNVIDHLKDAGDNGITLQGKHVFE